MAHEAVGAGGRSVAGSDELLDGGGARQVEEAGVGGTLEDERVAAVLLDVVVGGVG